MGDNESKNTKLELKALFQRIYSQLVNGCGRHICANKNCASHPGSAIMSQNEATSKALSLMMKRSPSFRICDVVEKIDSLHIERLLASPSDLRAAAEYVSRVFSSADVLEISFLNADAQGEDLLPCGKDCQIDFGALSHTYMHLHANESTSDALEKTLQPASLSFSRKLSSIEYHNILRIFFIIFLNTQINDPRNAEAAKILAKSMNSLSLSYREVLVRWIARFPPVVVVQMVETLHLLISIEILTKNFVYSEFVAHYLSLLDVVHQANKVSTKLSYTAFYNDAINEDLAKKRSHRPLVKTEVGPLNLAKYFFVLDPATKSKMLQYDSKKEMQREFSSAIFSSIFGSRVSPYLRIVVRRDSIVSDTLTQLQFYQPQDYKKPLKVIFQGEYGVDEGGVQKEFFQLIVRQIFLPEYGMFEYNSNTRQFWFNKDTLDNNSEYELIGTIVGLAIYNGVILNLHLPSVVYMKLLYAPVFSIEHLGSVDKELADGLQKLLAFEGDVEATYMRTFSIEYNVFGSKKIVELKPGGQEIVLNNENRAEYVDLYINYVLNQSIKEQFHHFYKGFHTVCSSPIFNWFIWEELKLLVCGSEQLDFSALEKACHYQDGYCKNSPTIKLFWEVIHELSEEEKKSFLFFTTGSDRVPIRGLGDMVLTISMNGTDENRLPSAHTCFDHLLLPAYTSKEKLRERLKLAIQNAEGFGLL